MMNIFGIIRIILLFIATVFVCVGTGVAQYRFDEGGIEALVFLYKQGPKGGPYTKTKDIDCNALRDRLQAAYAFAIISCIVIGILFFIVIASTFIRSVARIGGLVTIALSVIGMITSLIAWAISVGTFHGSYCDQTSAKDAGFDLYAGAALLIITWILMVIDVVLSFLGFFRRSDTTTATHTHPQHA